jgi:beta-N-acetylhexosaminidase
LSALVGQLVVAGFSGSAPSPALLDRIREGRIGGVLLYSRNLSAGGTAALAATLQEAAADAGRPQLLVAVDQEGGGVKRLPGAPSLAPNQMESPLVARAQGLATARNLEANGINVDFAPVLDIDHGGFIAPRTFAASPAAVSRTGVAFAQGLAEGGVAATVKHFPGLGYARSTTDRGPVNVNATQAELDADLAPFRAAIAADVPLVMVSTAVYPALGNSVPAATSRVIVRQLLRERLGYRRVVITDSLDTPGVSPFYDPGEAAVRAIAAGADLTLEPGAGSKHPLTDSDSAYRALLAAARSGELPRSRVLSAYRRVFVLKKKI